MDVAGIRGQLGNYPWYHVIEIADGLTTPGLDVCVPGQQKVLRAIRALDLRGKRVLDIGCRDGLFSFEAERQGASRVVGIDNDLSRGAVELLIPTLGSRVEMYEMNVIDLTAAAFGTFDVVFFAGVLYHLRYPFSGLKRVSDVLADGGTLVLETAVFADANRHALLYCPVGGENPYESTSVTIFNLKGLTDSLPTFSLRVEQWELEGNLEPDPTDTVKLVDRVVVTCRKDRSLSHPRLVKYWDGIHTLHSQGLESETNVGWTAAAARGPDVSPLSNFAQTLELRLPPPRKNLRPGECIWLALWVGNPGTQVWPALETIMPGCWVHLSYRWLSEAGVQVMEGIRQTLPRGLRPGERVATNLTVTGPPYPGSYRLRVTLVQEGVAWFDERGGVPLDLDFDVAADDVRSLQPLS
jgi:SAM-dependent methyltransferase